MSPWNWYVRVLRQYAQFAGRARRKEYWWFALLSFVISLSLMVVDAIVFGVRPASGVHMGLSTLYGLAVLLPSLGVSVRRLHDTNRSGWWLLLNLVPLVGPIVILVFMCMDSTPGGNDYGSNPKGVIA